MNDDDDDLDPPATDGLEAALAAPLEVKNLTLENIGELPESVATLRNLEVLTVDQTTMTTLPAFLAELPKLRKLQIEWAEKLKDVPIEIFAAPALREVAFYYCGLRKKYDPRKMSALLESLFKTSAPRETRLFQAALLFKDEKRALALGDFRALVEALDAGVIDVRSFALALVEKKLGAATFGIPQGGEIVIAGKLNVDRETLNERLEKKGARIALKLGPKTCAVVLGPQPNGKAAGLLDKGVPVVLERQLREVLDSDDTPHLIAAAKSDTGTATQLGELLMSDDDATVKLAVEMMKKGGVPPGTFEELVLAMQRAEPKTRTALQKLFAQYAPKPLQDAHKKVLTRKSFYGSGETKVTSRIKALAKQSKGAIDPIKLAKLLLRAKVGYRYLFEASQQDGALAVTALAALMDGDTLDLTSGELAMLPEAIASLRGLRRLLLRGNHLTAIPDAVLGSKVIEELDISGNRLEALPEALQGMSALRTLNAGENFIRTFPAAVCRATQLRHLDLSTKKWGAHREIPLDEIPDDIDALSELESFTFQAHALTTLPAGMNQLTKLRKLDLGYGKLGSLPAWVADLPALRELDLTNVEISAKATVASVAKKLRARGAVVKGA